MVEKFLNIDSLKVAKTLFFLGIVITVICVIYFPHYAKLKKMKSENEKIGLRIEELKREISELDKNLEGNKDVMLEKIARDELGVVGENEIVIDIKE